MSASHLEAAFLNLWEAHGNGQKPKPEYYFALPRRWHFDVAWPEHLVAVEIEGGVWINGRHNRPRGFIADCEKYNAATVLGWRVLRVPGEWLSEWDTALAVIAQVNRLLKEDD